MLFAGWVVRMVKNCDRRLENAARGRMPRAAFSRSRSQFFTIRTTQSANNMFIFVNWFYRLEVEIYQPLSRSCIPSHKYTCLSVLISEMFKKDLKSKKKLWNPLLEYCSVKGDHNFWKKSFFQIEY